MNPHILRRSALNFLGNESRDMNSPKTILITGGAGFIGSNFVRAVMEHSDWNVIVLDSLTYAGNLRNIADIMGNPRLTFVRGDICDSQTVRNLFATTPIDFVANLAAESHVDRSILGPDAFIKTNIEGTYILLEASRQAWQADKDSKRFLQVSTDEVYGSLLPDEAPFDETSNYKPNSPYAASKASSDHLVRAWHHTYGLPTIVSNCSNNYGPWQFPEKLIPLMILNACESKPLPVYGDGLQVRDWLHVKDHCSALLAILSRGKTGHTYCIGGKNEVANIDLVKLICDTIDRKLGRAPGKSRNLITHVEDRPGHDRRYAIDPTKICREVGWSPEMSMERDLPRIVDWYLENLDWVNEIRSGAYQDFYNELYRKRLKAMR